MITTAQAKQYIDSALGVAVPDFILTAAVEKVAEVEDALYVYSDADQILIQCMAVTLIAAAGAPRRIQNQGAASGASRSFKYSDKDISALRRALSALDSAGIVADLVGPDPSVGSMFMVV